MWLTAVVALVLSSAAYLVWTFLPPDLRPGDPTLVSDLAFLPGSFLVAILAWRASTASGISSGTRRAWRWIGLAFLLFWTGDALWFVYEIVLRAEPSPSVADVAYLAYYPALVIGLVSFPRVLRTSMERVRFGLDTATVVLGGAMVAWFLVIGPIASTEQADATDAFLSMAYPVGDLVLLLGVVILALRRPPDVRRGAITFLLAGLAAFLTADIIYGVQSLDATYSGGGLVDAINVVAWNLSGIGAYLALRSPEAAAAQRVEPVARDGVPLVPYVAVAIGYVMLLAAMTDWWTPTVAGLVLGAGGLTALVMARQLAAVKENLRLVAEREGRRAEVRLRSMVQNASDLILLADDERRILYATPSVARTLGTAPEALLGASLEELIHPDDLPMLLTLVAGVEGTGRGSSTYELRLVRNDGSACPVEISVLDRLDDPEMRGLVVTIRDIERRKQLEVKLARQAYHDALTGLPSSPLFMGSVAHALAQAEVAGADIALLYLGLDDFTAVNDAFGRAGGDALLVEATRRIQRAIGPDDLLGRVGGDEFAVLVERPTSPWAAELVADRILAELRRPHVINGEPASLRASLGMVVSTAARILPDDLLRTAEAAMRQAKREGKDRCVRTEEPLAA
jgi:diguanylate cyclase (GGDEF)-like protein/PAS domain S-box-containing protein